MKPISLLGGIVICVCLVGTAQEKSPALHPIDCTFLGEQPRTCGPAEFAKAMLQAKTAAIVANETTATWTELVQTLNPDISDEAYDKLRTSYFNAIVLPRLKPNFNAKVNFEYFMKGTHRPPFGQPFPKGVLRRALFENESEESANLRKRFTKLMAQLNRLTVVADPETADVVLEVRRYKPLDFSIGNTETVCFILVWPQGANPKTDQVMWFEKFEAKWKTSDDVAGAFRSFKRDLGLALKQAETADVRR